MQNIKRQEKPNKSGFVHGVGLAKAPSVTCSVGHLKTARYSFFTNPKYKFYETITKIPIRGYRCFL